jgi:MSHA biogenesis protein MshM
MLLVAARSGEGFIKVIGEVGTGKTLLCRKFLSTLDQDGFVTAYIPNPYVGPMTLLLAVADELGIEYPERLNQHDVLKLLTTYLLNAYANERRVVLCLDEAQAMPIETLEALRLLTNLETERRKLMQVVLFGQPELNAKLDNPAIRQLKQRISFSGGLMPLSLSDIAYYIAHRLSIAGYNGPRLFTDAAIKRLYKASRGVPRLVNVLSHKALMSAFGEGIHEVDGRNVKMAVRDTESVHGAWFYRMRLAKWLAPWART